ncbi:MAG TPA: formylglycine-generating enzyme family protein [Pyrinomonadaceae bacterium]|nr:formylglycine-generating enzyme family protein [Pyrinomonadaceae bacterium]
MAWYGDNSGRTAHPVGTKQRNNFGSYDMHGSVSEWCEDWYHENYNGAPTDGSAWVSGGGQRRVLRGGSWDNYDDILRSASRHWNKWSSPVDRCRFYGFRVVAALRK